MNIESTHLVYSFFLLFTSAIAGAAVARILKLPLLLGYIFGGILFGNLFPALIDRGFLSTVSDSGVTLLLFSLGVEFSFTRLNHVLKTVFWGVLVEILFVTIVMIVVLSFFQLPFVTILFVAVACSLSSTAVVVKLLSDRGELETLPGEISVGWLVIQDLAVIPILILLPVISYAVNGIAVSIQQTVSVVFGSVIKAGIILTLVVFLGQAGIPYILDRVSRFLSREIFLLTVIGLVFLSATVTYAAGLSAPIGAFIAGLLVASTSQKHAVFAQIRPLRDIFTVVFFVAIGMMLPISSLIGILPVILLITVVMFIVKWVTVYGLLRFLGHHRRTAFTVGIALLEMSEFGFILAKEGLTRRLISDQSYTFMVALTFLSIAASAPILMKVNTLYALFGKYVQKILPRFFREIDMVQPEEKGLDIAGHVVLCGYGRVGRYVGRALEMAGVPFVVIDYDQSTIASLRKKGIRTVYGDPADMDVLDFAQVDFAKSVIIAIPDRFTQEKIIINSLSLNRNVKIYCRIHHESDQSRLKSLGVHVAVQPEFEAAVSLTGKILAQYGVNEDDIAHKVTRLKIEHGQG